MKGVEGRKEKKEFMKSTFCWEKEQRQRKEGSIFEQAPLAPIEYNDQSAFRNSGPKRPFPLRFRQKRTRKMHQTLYHIRTRSKGALKSQEASKGKKSKKEELSSLQRSRGKKCI